MSGNGFVDQFLQGQQPSQATCFDVADSYVAMVDFDHGNGNHSALPYSTLLRILFDPSKGIRLAYSTDDVWIEGRKLEPLFKVLSGQRVTAVRAVGVRGGFEREDATVISQITVTPLSGSETS